MHCNNDDDHDGDEENEDSDCSAIGGHGPTSRRCSSSVIELRGSLSAASFNLQPPTSSPNDRTRCTRCQRTHSKSRQESVAGRRRSKCVKLCVPTVSTQQPSDDNDDDDDDDDRPARTTQPRLLAPSSAALATRRVSLPVPRPELMSTILGDSRTKTSS